jgi:hypothetical protein
MPTDRWPGRHVTSPDDVRRILDQVNRDGLDRANTTALARAIQPAGDVDLQPDASKLLPIDGQVAPLLPWPGLRRGATVAVSGSTSLLLLLLAGAMRDGSWCAVAGVPHLGCVAAAEMGVPLDRLALVPNPGPDWPTVVGALIDGFDLVVVGVAGAVADGIVRSLQARARQRGCVLVPVGAWPGSDVVLEVTGRRWEGLGHGHGRLRRQYLNVASTGRGRAAQRRTATVMLGQPAEAVRIPPPPPDLLDGEPVPVRGRQPDLWSTVEPNEPPDRWAALKHQVALPPRKRR